MSAEISNKLPYGELKYIKKNQLIELKEKPTYKHEVNTGVYLVNSKVFDLIPKNKFFDMNSLINKAFKFGKKITLYKVNKKFGKILEVFPNSYEINFVQSFNHRVWFSWTKTC